MTALPPTQTIGVIGAGTMGAGIAQVAAQAGHEVWLYDLSAAAVDAGLHHISTGLDKLVARGKMTSDHKDAVMGRLKPAKDLAQLANAALVVEVIVEKLDVKQDLFKKLEDICPSDTILASNTSSISITSIAAGLTHPERLVGMHFFNPAPIMKLVEVVSGLATSQDVATTIYDTATAWGKKAVYAKSTPGFIVNRVARPFYAEALRIVQEGGSDFATLDAVMRDCGGFRMGPFELMDLIGHDVNYAVTNSVFDAYYGDPRFLPSLVQKELVNAGRLGRKTNAGFYDYHDTAQPIKINDHPSVNRSVERIDVVGDCSAIASLIAMLKTLEGVDLQIDENRAKPAEIKVGSAVLKLCDGRFASVRSHEEGIENLIHFDLALDYATTPRIAIAKSLQATDDALLEAVAFFQRLGKQVNVIEDLPGLIVMRTVAMLANEGADAVHQQVCSPQDVDIAMKNGVNYPIGPLQWTKRIGLSTVYETLKGLGQSYGEDRYRLSPLILKMVAAGRELDTLAEKD
ncbi:3-hydroxyacyl-CoA dehydrogenase PaaH [Terasakiella pusilla]|uniref:3-hydroxyacyl-CoA dehydrogenase PaaH n=1 Tax=Terasakiella pusilla TaxID=64973 RepID=UPI00048C5BFC|nr:3-hydroxyacyl-CoA dehydrogenase PaaH [Terasakiella pusilla]